MNQESDTKTSKFPVFNGISISILVGLVVFTISVFVLIATVETNSYDEKMNIYFSNKTEFFKEIDGTTNNLVFFDKTIYDRYVKNIDRTIFVVSDTAPFLKKTFDPKTNRYRYSFDEKKVTEPKAGYYFQKSKYLDGKVFYSKYETKLTRFLREKDSITKQELAEKEKQEDNEKKFKKFQNSEKLFFNTHPKLLLWILLISMAIAFSFSVVPFLRSEIKNYRLQLADSKTYRKSVAFSLIVILLSIVPLLILVLDKFDYLIKPLDTVTYFSIGISQLGLHWNSLLPYFGVIFWLVLIFLKFAVAEKTSAATETDEQWVINGQEFVSKTSLIENITAQSEESVNKESVVETIQAENAILTAKQAIVGDIESKFESQFVMLAIFLAFTIFCTDLFVSTLSELIVLDDPNKIFPPQFSIMNGLMHTFFLGVIYLFVSGGLKRLKSKLLINNSATETTGGKSFITYFKLILTMLAPVIGGLVQKVLEFV
jgi:hypothetical protein